MARQSTNSYLKFGVYIVLVVMINLAGLTLFFRADLTENRVYSLSPVSREVVSTLTEPLTINVFFTKNLPAPYNTVERYLRDLLEEYAISGNRYFNYRFHDVTPLEEGGSADSAQNQRLASEYGIQPVQIQAIEQDEVKIKKAYMGLAIVHGDMVERIPTIVSADGLEYRLTTAIQRLNNRISALLRLKEPVRITLCLSPSVLKVAPYMGLKDLSSLDKGIEEIVSGLNRTMYGKLAFSVLEPSRGEEIADLSERYGLMRLSWPDLPQAGVEAGEGLIGLLVEHEGQARTLEILEVFRVPLFGTQYSLPTTKEIGEMITRSVESLIGINETVGYLADHGTRELYGMPGSGREPASNFARLASESYTLKQIDISEGGIPHGLKTLVIAGPTEEFSDYELYQIDQALMRGTSLAVFLDSFQEIGPPPGSPAYGQLPKHVPVATGLEKLLEHYGITVGNSLVMDDNCYVQRTSRQLGPSEQKIYYAPVIQGAAINSSHPSLSNIRSLVGVALSPLAIDEQHLKEHGITAELLFSSSERSWEMHEPISLNPQFIRPPASPDELRSFPLAYMLTGKFPSYFAGKPIPEMPRDDPGEEESRKGPGPDASAVEASVILASSERPVSILLVASSHMLADNVIDAEGRGPNSAFALNVLDVLNGRGDVAIMRSKVLDFNPLDETTVQARMFIKAFNVVGLPVLVVGFGLLVLLRRHIRRSRIERMFSTGEAL
ncbi:MAG: Gldg family protein [Desulfomonilia bacterium]|jgi:ABC-2 type transport system permease protein